MGIRVERRRVVMAQGARDVGAAHDGCTVVSGLGYLAAEAVRRRRAEAGVAATVPGGEMAHSDRLRFVRVGEQARKTWRIPGLVVKGAKLPVHWGNSCDY